MEPLLKSRIAALVWDEEAMLASGVPLWSDMPNEEQDAVLEELEAAVYDRIIDLIGDILADSTGADTPTSENHDDD